MECIFFERHGLSVECAGFRMLYISASPAEERGVDNKVLAIEEALLVAYLQTHCELPPANHQLSLRSLRSLR